MTTKKWPAEPTDLAIEDALDKYVSHRLAHARTLIPARVEAWHPDEQTIDAVPLVGRKERHEGQEIVVRPVPMARIPVSFPRFAGFVMRCPIADGDIVCLMASDRCLDEWLSGSGAEVVTDDPRAHDLDDCIALPGISPWGKPITSLGDGTLYIGREDGSGGFRVHADGTVDLDAGGPADTFMVRGGELQAWLSQVLQWLSTHQHPVDISKATALAPAPPAQPLPVPPLPATLLSSKAKVR